MLPQPQTSGSVQSDEHEIRDVATLVCYLSETVSCGMTHLTRVFMSLLPEDPPVVKAFHQQFVFPVCA